VKYWEGYAPGTGTARFIFTINPRNDLREEIPMTAKRRLPDNQLALIDMEPAPPVKTESRQKRPHLPERTESLERRVTQLEAEVALIIGQLEQSEDDD
jgi:hypothetical protein